MTDDIVALAKKLRVAFNEGKTHTLSMANWDDICDIAKQSWIRVAEMADDDLRIYPGDNTIDLLISRIEFANMKYGPVKNKFETLGALELELSEVVEAMQSRINTRVREELIDVAVVAIRGAMAL